jgi:hypothetical protein
MEESNPWLDSGSVKQVNKKSVKPVFKEREKNFDKSSEIHDKNDKREKIDAEKEKFGLMNVTEMNKKDASVAKFLDILLDFSLPEASKEWAIQHFGEEWFELFTKDIEYLKQDIDTSNFFPSQDKMIFLKYIFLLRQAI